MVDITLDLRRLSEIEIERDDLGNVRVAVEGRIDDDDKVSELLQADQIKPVSITVTTESEKDDSAID